MWCSVRGVVLWPEIDASARTVMSRFQCWPQVSSIPLPRAPRPAKRHSFGRMRFVGEVPCRTGTVCASRRDAARGEATEHVRQKTAGRGDFVVRSPMLVLAAGGRGDGEGAGGDASEAGAALRGPAPGCRIGGRPVRPRGGEASVRGGRQLVPGDTGGRAPPRTAYRAGPGWLRVQGGYASGRSRVHDGPATGARSTPGGIQAGDGATTETDRQGRPDRARAAPTVSGPPRPAARARPVNFRCRRRRHHLRRRRARRPRPSGPWCWHHPAPRGRCPRARSGARSPGRHAAARAVRSM